MLIRKGTEADIDTIMHIYDEARLRMRRRGNNSQWVDGYPSRRLIMEDIRHGNCYVGFQSGEIVMVFAFIIGDDPTYAVIEEGQWPNYRPYGTLHRLGALEKAERAFSICLDHCLAIIGNIRLDTHADNLVMQHLASAHGFVRCGIIYCADGSPRIAYQLTASKA